jgi:hypothetical protein
MRSAATALCRIESLVAFDWTLNIGLGEEDFQKKERKKELRTYVYWIGHSGRNIVMQALGFFYGQKARTIPTEIYYQTVQLVPTLTPGVEIGPHS